MSIARDGPPFQPAEALPSFRPIAGERSPDRRPSPNARIPVLRRRKEKERREPSPAGAHASKTSSSGRTVSDGHKASKASGDREEKRQRLSANFLRHPFGTTRKKHEVASVSGSGTSYTLDPPEYRNVAENGHTQVDGTIDTMAAPPSSTGSAKGKERISPGAGTRSSQMSHPTNSRQHRTPTKPESDHLSPYWKRGGSPDVDPSQIVQMALTLNESRRLGLAPGQIRNNGSLTGRRAASAGLNQSTGPFTTSYGTRPVSATISPLGVKSFAESPSPAYPSAEGVSRAASSSPAASRISSMLSPLEFDSQATYNVSPATLVRAEKAKAYFELCHQYRRLLECLPPLQSVQDSKHNHNLGRPYNPLQYVRNRRVRARERQVLDGAKGGWDHIDAVDHWVTAVEAILSNSPYQDGDTVALPQFEANSSSYKADTVANLSESQAKTNRREWKLDPADLLADAFWLEQDANKTLIETNNGDKVFRKFAKPTRARRSELVTRQANGMSPVDRRRELSLDEFPQDRSPKSEHTDMTDSDDEIVLTQTGSRESKPKTNRRPRFLRRRKSYSDDDLSGSDSADFIPAANAHSRHASDVQANIGPLERHMNMLLQRESRRDSIDSLQPKEADNSRGQTRRGGVSEEYKTYQDRHGRNDSYASAESAWLSPRSSIGSRPETPRISVDDFDLERGQKGMNGHATSPAIVRGPTGSVKKPRVFPLGFIHRRGRSKLQNKIEETDFATQSTPDIKEAPFVVRKSFDSSQDSLGLGPQSNTYEEPDGKDDDRTKSEPELATASPQLTKGAATRFFKGGRIGEIVRNEASPKSEVIWKAQAPRSGSVDSQDRRDSQEGRALLPPRDHRRSQSTNDLQRQASELSKKGFHLPNLPTFRSSKSSQPDSDSDTDHITRQQQARRDQSRGRKSRFDRLAPLSISSNDVSPNTSQPDLSRQETVDSSYLSAPDRFDSSRSPSRGLRQADKRLRKVLGKPGEAGAGGLPPTGLAGLDPNQRSRSRSYKEWNIGEEQTHVTSKGQSLMTERDIAYVRSLLMSSGIKAQTIVRRANEPPQEASDFLSRVSSAANVPLARVSRREEHVVAARILSDTLSKTISAFDTDAEHFRTKTCADLQSQVDDVRDKVNSQLNPDVRSAADDADAFIAKLTTTHTLAVKQVNDSVELMMRSRWRRLRWLRRAGFTLLEWVLVGIMWGIWMLVLVVKMLRAITRGATSSVRWLLWM